MENPLSKQKYFLKMIRKKLNIALLLFFVLTSLISCAPEDYTSQQYGFFSGIWHGLIWIFALIGKLFGADVGLYAENNTGFTYWLGFILGLSGLGGGGTTAGRKKIRQQN